MNIIFEMIGGIFCLLSEFIFDKWFLSGLALAIIIPMIFRDEPTVEEN